MKATIWHNPGCGTSRNALARLKEAGADITVIEYKQVPFERSKLTQLIADAELTPGKALRVRGTSAEELGLVGASDAKILDAMLENAMLVERPFVETDKGVRLCRPLERIEEIL